MNYQHIYFYIDDSGKISRFEDYAIFAGIVFTDSKEVSAFKNKYKSILRSIKCTYCEQTADSCSRNCPEVKGVILRSTDRRRVMNLSKQFVTFATVIYNQDLARDIIGRTQSKGRFVEYAQRRLIKETTRFLIGQKLIDPNLPVYMHINIDEMPTKSNGYYTLQEGVREELVNGISNFNYNYVFRPVLFSGFEIQVLYRDSARDVCIQMADIISNTVRHSFIVNSNYYQAKSYLMERQGLNVILRLPR